MNDVESAGALQILRISRSEFQRLRGLRVHVRRWGDPQAPTLVLLHGWMDTSATFQFLVDALRQDWNVLAPDWPGSGLSEPRTGDYLTPSYIADLDALLEIYSPRAPVFLAAHSMAGQIGALYCGARPERVAALVNIDGMAPVPPFEPEDEVGRLRGWLEHARDDHSARVFVSTEEFANTLQAKNPRLTRERAAFLACNYTRTLPDGRAELLMDPRQHRTVALPRFPVEALHAALRTYLGRVLWILGGQSSLGRTFLRAPGGAELLQARLSAAPHGRHVTLNDAGHNIQHDAPERLAQLLESFLNEQAAVL